MQFKTKICVEEKWLLYLVKGKSKRILWKDSGNLYQHIRGRNFVKEKWLIQVEVRICVNSFMQQILFGVHRQNQRIPWKKKSNNIEVNQKVVKVNVLYYALAPTTAFIHHLSLCWMDALYQITYLTNEYSPYLLQKLILAQNFLATKVFR